MPGHTGKTASSSPSPHSTSMGRDETKPTAHSLDYISSTPICSAKKFILSLPFFPPTSEGHEKELLKKSSTSQACCSQAPVPAAGKQFPPRSPETALSAPRQPRWGAQGKGTGKARKEKSNEKYRSSWSVRLDFQV